jgi:hypothetical protein
MMQVIVPSSIFSFYLSETDALFFKTFSTHFEVFSKHESSNEIKIAEMRGGKWGFEDYHQRKLFFHIYSAYRKQFGKAIRQYSRSLNTKPKTYVFTCFKRKVAINIFKLKKNIFGI